MAKIQLEEAIRLGLVSEETLAQLSRQGIVSSPFAGRSGGRSPFWSLPPVVRGGLFRPRFGLGPLAQGLSLSPPAPAISGGGIPVGRAASRGNQAAPPLETLIGRGDMDAIVRGIQNGTINPNALPPSLLAAIMPLLQRASGQGPGQPAGPGAAYEAFGTAKKVLNLAKQALDPNSPARLLLEQAGDSIIANMAPALQSAGGVNPDPSAPEAQQGGGAAHLSPQQPPEVPQPGTVIGGTTPFTIPPEVMAPGAGGGAASPGFEMANAQPFKIPEDVMTGVGGGGASGFNPSDFNMGLINTPPGTNPDAWAVSALENAITAGAVSAADVAMFADLGYSTADIAQILGGAEATSAGLGTAGSAIGSIAQWAPYAGAALNIGMTASGPGTDEYKAATAAIDVASAALAGVTAGFSMILGTALKSTLGHLMRPDIPHDVRENMDLANRIAPDTSNFIQQVSYAKTMPELYRTLKDYTSGSVGGTTDRAIDIMAKPSAVGPEWHYLGLYGPTGQLDPRAPSAQEFFARLTTHPEDFQASIQAGVDPAKAAKLNDAVMKVVTSKAREIQLREQVRPHLIDFSRLAGVYVNEDDVMNAMGQAGQSGITIDSPEFSGLLRQAERQRAADLQYKQAFEARFPGATLEKRGNIEYTNMWDPSAFAVYQAPRTGAGQNAWVDPVTGAKVMPMRALEKTYPEESYLPSSTFLNPLRAEREKSPEYAAALEQAGGQRTPDTERLLEPPPLTYQPNVGWVDATGAVVHAAPPMPEPIPFGPIPSAPIPATVPTEVPPPSPQAATAPLPGEEPVRPLGSLKHGGIVPQTGLYQLHEGEVVVPAEQDGALAEQAPALPEGNYYLDPKSGVPFQAGSNPEPDKFWRLAFDATQLHDSWQKRGKDGHPLLVPPSILERTDWPSVVEAARRTQYETVHPAVAMARGFEPNEFDQAPYPDVLMSPNLTHDEIRFRFGTEQEPPTPQPTPPMRQMPGQRPMTTDEERQLLEGWNAPETA